MNFYIQLNFENYITDCITYPVENYIPVMLEIPLPDKFIAGCYKWLGDHYEIDQEKYNQLSQESTADGVTEIIEDKSAAE